jgi:hypothetical protein
MIRQSSTSSLRLSIFSPHHQFSLFMKTQYVRRCQKPPLRKLMRNRCQWRIGLRSFGKHDGYQVERLDSDKAERGTFTGFSAGEDAGADVEAENTMLKLESLAFNKPE